MTYTEPVAPNRSDAYPTRSASPSVPGQFYDSERGALWRLIHREDGVNQ